MQESRGKLRILVPMDGSKAAEASLVHAVALAQVFPSELVFLQVVGDNRSGVGNVGDCVDWQLRQRQAAAYLEQIESRVESLDISTRCIVEYGNPAAVIARLCDAQNVDLIVMSRLGRTGAAHLGDGSVTRKVVSVAKASVLLVNSDETSFGAPGRQYRNIVVPVDDSQGAEWSVALAASIAQVHHASLSLVRVLESPCADVHLPKTLESRMLLERMNELSAAQASRRFSVLRSHIPPNIRVKTELKCADNVSGEIVNHAASSNADLIVLCAHGSGGEHPWPYGQVAESLLAHCMTPVLVFQQANEAAAQHYRSRSCDLGEYSLGEDRQAG